ncbi:sulfurtransferase TusA family protein [Candidatus Acidulodesulfobacterium sp. H_13]|uniref:sulfurtransferase TusA family protein n=1 Tax=Candidatus Acidulodesulfobacterium sp. H_13 TaxID=3395470 RepID=UPI003AF71326
MTETELRKIEPTITIDARDAYCPGPLMELIKEMRQQPVGSIIELMSGDAGSAKDVPEWLNKVHQEFLGVISESDYWRIFSKKIIEI